MRLHHRRLAVWTICFLGAVLVLAALRGSFW